MQLITQRLQLTTLQPEDWQLFRQVHTDKQSMSWISAIPSEEGIRQRFADRLAPWQITSYHMLCLVVSLKDSGEKLGLMGANAEWLPHRQVEVGYSFLNQHCGQGYGSEALGVLCDFLLVQCEFHKLKASVVEGNYASRRVLEKNGFMLEGTLRDNYLLRGQWVNDWVFGRLNPDH
ncbi:GNAT family N-acetyltransferase [Paramixta manurensis]|uniref:GNAT family N-acetyltransferase n=1 Tax=Paramixta manurensis TaxID=2740817 RepID=A0A6M8UI70_9GAMM|nr:GNAT family N-acetyltransferase [Erwiniaceae bacterium PD-1]